MKRRAGLSYMPLLRSWDGLMIWVYKHVAPNGALSLPVRQLFNKASKPLRFDRSQAWGALPIEVILPPPQDPFAKEDLLLQDRCR